MQPDPRARARDRVLYRLKTRGPQTASALASRLGITAMAVRQHLAALEEEGLVAYVDERRKVGRPARLWRLTPEGSERFPDTHADLTLELIDAVKATFGDEGLDRLVQRRTREQLDTYRAELPGKDSPLEKRIAALAGIRRREGYMAEWTREGDGFLLVENHCPICAAARTCQGLCREELQLFRTVLGGNVTVERVDHILSGARRCAYRILPRQKRGRAPLKRGRGRDGS
jgi:predicted ArsR family transcriptional regulator